MTKIKLRAVSFKKSASTDTISLSSNDKDKQYTSNIEKTQGDIIQKGYCMGGAAAFRRRSRL